MKKLDLNCDLGESFGHYTIGNDELIIPYVSSVNVACGFHAGDPATLEKTVQLAKIGGTKVGAHPGFDDRLHFGRRPLPVTEQESYQLVLYQLGALAAFCKATSSRKATRGTLQYGGKRPETCTGYCESGR